MKTWVRKSLKVGVLSAGILLAAGNAAQADWNTSDNDGVLNGNQLDLAVSIPVDITGNAVGVAGDAAAVSGQQQEENGDAQGASAWDTGNNDGVGTGNQVLVPVHIPVNICGNAVAVLGDAVAACGAEGDEYESTRVAEDWTTGDNGGVLTGNQVLAVVTAPIDITGNAVGIAGDAAAVSGHRAGGDQGGDRKSGDRKAGGRESGGPEAGWTTGDNDGVLTGNQVLADVDIPVNICGNSVAVLGDAVAACGGGGAGDDDYDDDGGPSRRTPAEALPVVGGAGGLTQLTRLVPQADGLLGGARQVTPRPAAATEAGWTTGDNDGVATGNQAAVTLDLPLTIAANAVAVAGDAVAAKA